MDTAVQSPTSQAAAGWLFTAPALLMIIVFLVVPILMAAWVSVSDWSVLPVVPVRTILSFFLAVVVNRRRLAGRGFFRTAYYFPSVTSSVAIAVVFLFMFSGSGVINTLPGKIGVSGPTGSTTPMG